VDSGDNVRADLEGVGGGGTIPLDVLVRTASGIGAGCGLDEREERLDEKAVRALDTTLFMGGTRVAVCRSFADGGTDGFGRKIRRLPVGVGFLEVDIDVEMEVLNETWDSASGSSLFA
jgi:hypothetical protein